MAAGGLIAGTSTEAGDGLADVETLILGGSDQMVTTDQILEALVEPGENNG